MLSGVDDLRYTVCVSNEGLGMQKRECCLDGEGARKLRGYQQQNVQWVPWGKWSGLCIGQDVAHAVGKNWWIVRLLQG